MWQWLVNLAIRFGGPLWNWLIQRVLQAALTWFSEYVARRREIKAKKQAIADAKKELAEAGTNPALSPEQKAKEIEDAADKLNRVAADL